MKQLSYTLLFLVINFIGLAIGSWLMNNGPQTNWYLQLNKAPWTPPGWVFGVAWTTIMICFSIYLAKLFTTNTNVKSITIIFTIAFFLNLSWNYLFFNQHLVLLSLISISILTLVIFYYFLKLNKTVANYHYLLLPYVLWLCIATSLNLYILLFN